MRLGRRHGRLGRGRRRGVTAVHPRRSTVECVICEPRWAMSVCPIHRHPSERASASAAKVEDRVLLVPIFARSRYRHILAGSSPRLAVSERAILGQRPEQAPRLQSLQRWRPLDPPHELIVNHGRVGVGHEILRAAGGARRVGRGRGRGCPKAGTRTSSLYARLSIASSSTPARVATVGL